jgi:hypothetical protein
MENGTELLKEKETKWCSELIGAPSLERYECSDVQNIPFSN